MSDELTNGDQVRMVDDHDRTGIYIGYSYEPGFPDVVRQPDTGHTGAWAIGTWERIPPEPFTVTVEVGPDECVVVVPKEMRDRWAEREGHSLMIAACRKSKEAEADG